MAVVYEWDVEIVDTETKDVLDHYHNDKLKDAIADIKTLQIPSSQHFRLVLVRDQGNDSEGLLDRQWCYLDDLPRSPEGMCTEFDGGTKVPKRYLAEFESHADELSQMIGSGRLYWDDSLSE